MARNPAQSAAKDSPATDEAARLQQQIAELQADVARLLQGIADLGHAKGESMVDAVKAKADSAAAQADQKLEEARTYVQANPLQALGFAALAGLIFGLLFGRR